MSVQARAAPALPPLLTVGGRDSGRDQDFPHSLATSGGGALGARPSSAQIQAFLENVPDPEIPVLSIVDLGIVRAIEWETDKLVVTVTPTYSGCPATAVIALDIGAALERVGIQNVEVRTQLAPPWTTGWISEVGRKKLKAYGIAPPAEGSCAGAVTTNEPSGCPHCGSAKVERVSQFGSTPCKAAWRCAECLEPFDYFKRF